MTIPLERRLKEQAQQMGFALTGIATAAPADHFERFQEWLARGYAGTMDYLHEQGEARREPSSILENVHSVLMVGMTYPTTPAPSAKIAKYALVPDYHRYLWDKLNELRDWLQEQVPGCHAHGVTDTAPLLERDYARRAGLGWFGKNTMLIDKTHGSFLMLGALLTTLDLTPDTPHANSHCGTCTACLDACPTQAFPAPGWLDARRCISYLNIELKTAIPEEFRTPMGEWLFGCDICQDVCPWNRHERAEAGFPRVPEIVALEPEELLTLTPSALRKRFKGTSLRRANWRGLLRNAAIVLGNRGDPKAIPILERATNTPDAVVREACEWAIAKLRKQG